MKRYKIFILVVLIIIIIAGVFFDTFSPEKRKQSEAYKKYEKSQQAKLVNNYLKNYVNNSWDGNEIISDQAGTTSNFEGPQVLIEYLKFHDTHFNTESNQMPFFDGNTLNFDPDHPSYGLPNFIAKISPVSIYNPEVSGLASLLRIGENDSKPKPYRIYHKAILGEESNDSIIREFEMQLWLTEFKVTVDIQPDRKDPVIALTSEEKERVKYPGYWYSNTQDFIKLGDLKPEWKNNRYSNVTLILKIIPNNAPWYFKTRYARDARPGMGIGAIYCESLCVTREEDENRVSPNIQKGSVIFLHPSYDPSKDSIRNITTSENLESAAQTIFDKQKEKIDSTSKFWNKPFYIRLFFNNIGSWKERWYAPRKYDDQVTFSFLMPVFVIGSWDIIPPKEIIPEWTPPKPYYKDFFKNIFPTFGLKNLGKILAIAGWIIVLVLVLPMIFPALSNLFGKIFK